MPHKARAGIGLAVPVGLPDDVRKTMVDALILLLEGSGLHLSFSV